MTTEAQRAKEEGRETPIWPSKEETDRCYDECAERLVQRVKCDLEGEEGRRVGLVFATHNVESVRKVLLGLREGELLKKGFESRPTRSGELLVVDERLPGRLVFGQLLGEECSSLTRFPAPS